MGRSRKGREGETSSSQVCKKAECFLTVLGDITDPFEKLMKAIDTPEKTTQTILLTIRVIRAQDPSPSHPGLHGVPDYSEKTR